MIGRRGFIGTLAAFVAVPWAKVKAAIGPGIQKAATFKSGPYVYAYYTYVNSRTGEETRPVPTDKTPDVRPPLGHTMRVYHSTGPDEWRIVPPGIKVEP